MANRLDVTLHALGEEPGAGESAAIDIGPTRSAARLTLTATSTQATPLVVQIETSPNSPAGWRFAGSFAATEEPSSQALSLDRLDRYVRVRWNTGATFQVAGEAHDLYATRPDLYNEVPQHALEGVEDDVIADALIKASVAAEDAIATSNPVPLTTWPLSVSQACAQIAVWRVITRRGIQPDGPDGLIKESHDEALLWLKRVARGEIKPPGLVPADNLGVKTSSGDPNYPDVFRPKFANNWGDF